MKIPNEMVVGRGGMERGLRLNFSLAQTAFVRPDRFRSAIDGLQNRLQSLDIRPRVSSSAVANSDLI